MKIGTLLHITILDTISLLAQYTRVKLPLRTMLIVLELPAFSSFLGDESTADVIFKIGETNVVGHKVILAASSPVFKVEFKWNHASNY